MALLQGEFVSKAAAQQAKDSLVRAGIPAAHIRIWNIIPESVSAHSSTEEGAVRGAIVGGFLGGAIGLGIGAAAGAASDASSGGGFRLPGPTGVRLVVDINTGQADSGAPDVASLLRKTGATNIHRESTCPA